MKIAAAKKSHGGTASSITSEIGMSSATLPNRKFVSNNPDLINQWDMVLKQFIKDSFFKHVSLVHCSYDNNENGKWKHALITILSAR